MESKPTETFRDGAALVLKICTDVKGKLFFKRGSEIPEKAKEQMNRRKFFSLCGKLIGHYPVAGWRRVACSYVKRLASGTSRDHYIGDDAHKVVQEVLAEVSVNDPVQGVLNVQLGETGNVWCDASSIALAGATVKDAAWLRKKDDFNHINVAD